jgi:hypothetical protein
MTSTVYRVTYYGPTDYRGSRYIVRNLKTRECKTFPFDHSASNAAYSAVSSMIAELPEAAIVYGGEDTHSYYYIVTVPSE